MAIPLFVKVTPYVAEKIGLANVRFQTADGNFLLRQSDFLCFGPLSRLPEYVAAVGGVVLRDADAAANQRGELNTPLPEPNDPEWATPTPEPDIEPEQEPTTDDESEEPSPELTEDTAAEEDGNDE